MLDCFILQQMEEKLLYHCRWHHEILETIVKFFLSHISFSLTVPHHAFQYFRDVLVKGLPQEAVWNSLDIRISLNLTEDRKQFHHICIVIKFLYDCQLFLPLFKFFCKRICFFWNMTILFGQEFRTQGNLYLKISYMQSIFQAFES